MAKPTPISSIAGGCKRSSASRVAKFALPICEVADVCVALPCEKVKTVDIVVVVEIASERRRCGAKIVFPVY